MNVNLIKAMKDAEPTTKSSRGMWARLRKEEDGGMIIFSLFMFVLILWFGGMAVDLMRFETTRAKLQATLDRATLAAADMDQVLPCEDVVTDYFTKAGMESFLEDIDCDDGINYRVVSADASAQMPLFFYDLPNVFTNPFETEVSTLTVSGGSTAEERVTDVEVSLVLDVSGSMSRNNRIQNLRPAARDFVTTVLANNTNAPEGLITISMIPYSAVVNPGTSIEPFMNINRAHEFSTCPLFMDDTLFETTELDLSETYEHVAHFDPDWYSADAVPIANPWCHVGDHNSIIVGSTNEQSLHDAIDALEPYGNTAIDMGVKWGAALLDPSTGEIFNVLANTSGSDVPIAAANRPQDFNQPDVLKVIVVMTDGANTQQYDLHDRFKWGTSFIWFNLDSVNEPLQDVHRTDYSIQYSGLGTPTDFHDDWFYTHNASSSQRFRNYPDGYSSNWEYRQAMANGPLFLASPGVGPTYENNVRNASWQELYAVWEHNRVNNSLLSRAYNAGAIPWSAGSTWAQNLLGQWVEIFYDDYSDPDSAINYSLVNSSEADDRLSDICAAARAQGIIVYTVAFEAPSAGQAALADCASSPSHYFDVSGTDISSAFAAIASDIRALKLTE
ncbi:MAG: pilus assembly protein TadG-related protein [Pseudomonadota bacterium]